MLREIRLRDVGVIADATLELSPGLTVITGETGAGKTMVVTGLGLLLGARADPAAVRAGAQGALVEGRFGLDEASPAAARAAAAGAELDEGDLIVARTVAAPSAPSAPSGPSGPPAPSGPSGRSRGSRAHLGGRAVPVAVLAEMAEDLVAVHGQSEQVLLRSPARQRRALDAFAGQDVARPAVRYAAAWRRFATVRAEVERLQGEAAARTAEHDLLRAALAEVERAAPLAGEDVELAAEAERLEHAEELAAAAARAHAALVGDEASARGEVDAVTLVEAARRALELAGGHDRELDTLGARVRELAVLVVDVAADLASYSGSGAVAAADPGRLEVVQARRAELTALARARGGQSVADLLAWTGRSRARLAELERAGGSVEELVAERDALDAELVDLAATISRERRRAADALGEAATAELPGLSMPHAALGVVVTTTEAAGAAGLGPHGADEVSFVLSAPGSQGRPLGRGASGGELSRVMLALELVLAASASVPTFVFDEVDAGVGGRAAVGIGQRLARLARTRQVVVVTHLPQVAAFADAHVLVAKGVRPGEVGLVTVSDVRALDGEERVAELARMLAGQERSETARAHARELLAMRGALR